MSDYLLDTSALVRLHRDEEVRQKMGVLIESGRLGVCPITELELLYIARNAEHRLKILESLGTYYAWVVMPDKVFQRARQVQEVLTERGQHRSAGPVDLLVAATAELTSRTLLHYDRDFETVAQATGQAARWLAPPGSID